MEALIALGSNLGERENILNLALDKIEACIGKILARSSNWETTPEFPEGSSATAGQANFINAVIACESQLSASKLLLQLLEIEKECGRAREQGVRYQARTLDLDLLALGSLIINQADLTLPHPQMHKRKFVLGPLAEIRKDWVHPVLGKSVQEMYWEVLNFF